jgi:GPH family glycoside/pentoside/hexuronide:cation symporter
MSFFTALARCIELIFKPLVAHWSDNSNFYIGRRKPFMVFGCGFYAIFLVSIFSLPDKLVSPLSTSIWFGSFYVLFFIADTVVNIPYQALGPELSKDTKEREKLYLVFYVFQYIGVLFASVAPIIIQYFFNNKCDCKHCDGIMGSLQKERCINLCKSACGVETNEKSLLYMCMFVGIFFVMSIIVLSTAYKERNVNNVQRNEIHIVPTLFRLINNEPFMRLLVPWILDATISQIFATMLPFFVTFIVNPQNYCIKNKIDFNSAICSVNSWIGITIFIFFIFVLLFMGVWHWIIGYIGKNKAWQAYSLMSIVTFSLFLFCGEGMMIVLVILSVINAFPGGAGYLTDVFVSDCIDYDEFLTGKRNEGIFIVFSSFTPKVVGILAQSIPLTIMSCN